MSERMIETPHGPGRLVSARARAPIATLLLSHGAGVGIDTGDLEALAAALPAQGFSVMLFEQPWKVAGRKVAGPPPTLDAGLKAAANSLRIRTPLVVGGRSAGARSAARTAADLAASGCLCLAFPLHPPGKPEKSRIEELRGLRVPTLVVQGARDTMGRPEEFPDDLEGLGIDLVPVPEADHSLRVGKRGPIDQEQSEAILVESVLEWLTREVAGNGAGS